MTIAKNIIFRANDEAAAATISLQDVLDVLNTKIEEDGKARFPNLWDGGRYETLLVEHVGQKYIKIISGGRGSRSVYCFLDYAGNIYKAASWKAPAKHVRGSVFHDDCSWGRGLGPYGAAYLR
jgi:hypothetical protein